MRFCLKKKKTVNIQQPLAVAVLGTTTALHPEPSAASAESYNNRCSSRRRHRRSHEWPRRPYGSATSIRLRCLNTRGVLHTTERRGLGRVNFLADGNTVGSRATSRVNKNRVKRVRPAKVEGRNLADTISVTTTPNRFFRTRPLVWPLTVHRERHGWFAVNQQT